MAEITRRLLGRMGSRTCYLVYADGEEIGRVFGDRMNAKNTLWTAFAAPVEEPGGRTVISKVHESLTLAEGVDALAKHHASKEHA
jgi:hypothetical protein